MECSFGLLKPDCLKRGIEKEVLSEIEAAGLGIIAVKRVRLTKKEVDVIWEPCAKEDFYQELLGFSLSGDCLVFIVKGDNSIGRLNDLVGHYHPEVAKEHTIRHRFGKSAMENVIHSTGDEQTFLKEASLFFARSELISLSKEK
ncbi:MAG: hypothetical protein HYW69_02305 [Candidatus Nealsonbacteria bacterium]|nr:hypothetical protein [Candidatus Nealsonbacteria bacterium]